MGYTLWQRIKMFFCDKFGHVKTKDKGWEYNNRIHNICKRCRIIYSVDKENSNESQGSI